ncbi:uncharacterized protein LOC130985162 isoform X2 [Salvia miltiorrhiza]|uniref:uncharacterized protein LOC130985162 isoform X2 n=1 Tax=Salvia miltiorrhiza TaxID=226208 RepID=UPI0025AB9E99|nr:uncharacterized protein LOC130985162 isoform X2 [Salvia miltiorrhiza]
MEYERIHKVQTGILSPSKLRIKLMGPHHQKKKDGSNSNSSRTSPSKMEDSEFVNNSLLAAQNGDFGEEVSNLEVLQIKSDGVTSDGSQGDGNLLQSKELGAKDNGDASRFRMQLLSKVDTGNSSSVHPVRMCEDENLDYDSTSSFEFHKGERSLHHSMTRSFSRPMSSKWNDAEKWIMNKQNVQSNISKKANLQNQVNRQPATNMVRVVPESTSSENKPSVKRVDFCQSASQMGSGKFALIDLCPESKDLGEVDDTNMPCTKSVTEESTVPAIRSVSMRDMGTEMTPIPSQEPSRSATPVSATTPLRSPTSSIPSTPRRGEPAPTPTEHPISNSTQNLAENAKRELSEQEQKLKTRREIVALGVQLGKMNIAAWASTDEKDKSNSGNEAIDNDELAQIEYTKRAAAWEEAEKAKHAARYKREEIRIQAWESQQKARLEAEMRQIEAQIEQMKAQAQAKMVKKVAMARQKSEEKRAAAEARKNRQAEKTASQAEYIRQTGRIPSSPFICCGWS